MSQCEPGHNVLDWLCVLRLEQYSEVFQSAGLTTLRQCRNLTPDQLEAMGITLPGHQRRILASLSKSHSNRDTQSDMHAHHAQETGHAQALLRDRPVPVPLQEKPVLMQQETRDGEAPRPAPREREKPVPKDRQVSRMKEGNGREKNPVPEKRQAAPRQRKDEHGDGGIDGEKERPVPKERTKFRSTTPVDCPTAPQVSPPSEPSLPPVPPRSTPNCPPQPFTSALSPSPPARTLGSPKLDSREIKAPPVQSEPQTLVPTSTRNSAQTRPNTLAIQPSVQHVVSDEGRKMSPVSSTASLSDVRNAPPLPPKAGGGPKGAPPIPQRFPAQSPMAHR